MSVSKIGAGSFAPQHFNVIIELPMQEAHVKYEVDKETGALKVDRFFQVAMHYPHNYGYIPGTLGGDGDPLDVLVLSGCPILPMSLVVARAIGILFMEDEAGSDEKVIAVPQDSMFDGVEEVSSAERKKIAHFFECYKLADKDKWVKIQRWGNAEEAKTVIAGYLKV